MTDVSPERLETARLVGQTLSSREGRDFLHTNGYESGSPVIACEWETSVEEVMTNLRASGPSSKATVAIRRGDKLYWMGVEQSKSGSDKSRVHAAGTIGLMYQATQHGSWSVQITNMSTARAMLPA